MGIFASTFNFGDFPFIFALILTLLCFVLSRFVFNFTFIESVGGGGGGGGRKKKKVACCSCECKSMAVTAATAPSSYMNGGGGGAEVVLERSAPAVQASGERQIGASMMEQLVPEITTHALSYLDFPSLCRLSMTNSSMRKAANDDNAWKALYHKDFTTEQDSVTPPNGWKAYYAATRAIVNINAEFFNIIREKDFQEMGRLWLNADYVKCVHASGELFTGYNAVMGSWQIVFNWEPGVNFQVQEVRARVLTDMAWVTMKAYVDMEQGPLNITNFFEFHNGHWYMVHHHSSVMLNNGMDDHPHMLA